MSTDDRERPPAGESTSALGAAGTSSPKPDATAEPEDAERTPTADAMAAPPPEAESTPAADPVVNRAPTAPNALSLHDKASNVRATITEFPSTIGNSPECGLALKGPGPVGVYARLRHERNAFIVERAHSETPLVVNEKELRSVILMDGDVLMLGEHEVHVRFDHVDTKTEKEQPGTGRKNRLRVVGAAAVVVLLLVCISVVWSRLSQPEKPRPTPAGATNSDGEAVAGADWGGASQTVEPPTREPSNPQRPAPADQPATEPPPIAEVTSARPPRIATIDESPDRVDAESDSQASANRATAESPVADGSPGDTPVTRTAAESADAERSRSRPAPTARTAARVAAINEAMALYASGAAEQAIDQLEREMTGMPGAGNARLGVTRETLAAALTAYRDGLAARDAGRPLDLIRQRGRLAAAESALAPPQPSDYLRTLNLAAVDIYRDWARTADRNDETADAYRWYRRVLMIQPDNEEAVQRIAALDQAAKEQYLTGYRLETKDIKSALLYWRKAESMVPRDSRWHRLANEKLNDYAYFKNRG